ncbi:MULTISPECIES: N-acetylmuramoyl-L-alanine amidase [Corynebacterium]|uniref:N-acetylmuramoyl-L-alanine amidase n=1 Tax=Corynebacterium coyleae TaxID=53374 RepID=A0AAP6XKL3_9CORY|nr:MULTISPECIES: N-acetylmuramoyl-L-alanine amidase [Corynebacterium]MDK6492722.1 N-acetylmuramoyl-L-alanine amidase [Corynebacterium coyleae]MDK8663491.1 N-acetylmuramoyl-L-alanine amidase [Corynebacterium coyleae]MDK8707499.1 N-acetylmuramoyl-L-alanine amidase [Corynebacterium coyleae]MDK8734347.1 N-acetylmuramoyl-L-alanine amidase [Corynebacterium coyleae]MDK8799463.1 N-acetylmuramoyl-L-alanine amidase [Corynebacterium coyleae]
MQDLLHVGDSSSRVAEVRLSLARLGLLDGYEGEIDSTRRFTESEMLFDDTLAEALKAFQQSRGILPSGSIDDLTLRELREASYTLGARVLSYQPGQEMVGDDVGQLQTQLHELGFYSNRIDGRFGPATYEALMNYQLNSGLEDDGVCGPDTLHALSLLGRRITGGSAQAIRERETVRQAGPNLAGKRVVIDPDLGGSDKGLVVEGPYGPITEEEILWDLAQRIEGRMVATGMETILSRPRGDNPSNKHRADLANGFNADLLISLRLDSYPNEKANGVATFYFGSEHGSSSMTGETLSGYIQREIAARTDLQNCRNHARTWEMLRMTRMPSVELVAGYLTNPGDLAVLTDPAQRDAIAEAVVVAVKRLYLLDHDTRPTGTYSFKELLREEQA